MAPQDVRELFGRDDALARCRAADVLSTGTGGLLLIAGDAGIGKTALVSALAREATDRWRVLLGHCVGEAGASLPYLPFTEMFARLDAVEPGLVDDLLQVQPAVAHLIPRRAPSRTGRADTDATGDADRGLLVEAVHAALEWLGGQRPVFVVVEDLHWADESSRELLTLLFTRGFTTPVALVASYRSDDLHRRHPLRSALVVWSRLSGLGRLDLGPLDDGTMSRLVRANAESLDDPTVADIVHRADGNAFFAEELAAASRLGLGADTDLTRLLLSRVERLDEEGQRLVRVASVIGRRFTHALLVRVLGLPDTDLDVPLRQVIEHHILEPRGNRYAFRHALLAEAVYDDLLPGERLRHHRACADALIQHPELGTVADLARHALAAGDTELAITAASDAGDAAMRLGGPAEALSHFENALRLCADGDERHHLLTLRAAGAATGVGRVGRAIELLRAGLARTRGSDLHRAQLLSRLAFVLRFTEDQTDRLALTDEALALIADLDAPNLRAELLGRRAEALLDADRTTEAVAVAEQAMDLAVAENMRHLQTDLDAVIARITEDEGDPLESIRRLEGVLASWGETTDLAVLRAMHLLASIHFRQGALPTALAAYRRCTERAREVGLQWAPYGIDSLGMSITVAYLIGEWDTALELAEPGPQPAPPQAVAALDAASSCVHAGRGSQRPATWYSRIRQFWQLDGLYAVQSGAATIDAHGFAGDLPAARRVHADVVASLRRLWNRPRVQAEVRLSALLLGQLGSWAGQATRHEHGALLAEADGLLRQAEQVWGPGSTANPPSADGQAWLARARAETLRVHWLAGEQVDGTEMVTAWQRAADLFTQATDPYETARCQARLAAVSQSQGQLRMAAELAGQAREVATRLQARPLLAELEPLLAAAPSSQDQASTATRQRPATGSALTHRELEVLALVAQGRSNGQVGRQLFISTKTASVHVSNILAKLGAANRAEAAAVARDRGLLG